MRPYSLGLAAAIALSRVYLRVHFPLDILAGGVIGAGLGALVALTAMGWPVSARRDRPERTARASMTVPMTSAPTSAMRVALFPALWKDSEKP